MLYANDLKFEYVDVTSGEAPLKAFLKIRDHDPAFDEVRSVGRVGIPFFVTNDRDFFFGVPTPELLADWKSGEYQG